MITRTSSGKLQHRDFRVDQSCPAWLTEQTAGGSTITYDATGCTISSSNDSAGAMLTTADPLDVIASSLDDLVIRVKAKKTSLVNNRAIQLLGVWNWNAVPTPQPASISYDNPHVYFYRTAGGVEEIWTGYNSTVQLITPVSESTFYIGDVYWSGANVYIVVRSATDMSQLATANYAHNYTLDPGPWWTTGDPRNAAASSFRADSLVEYVQMMESYDITVTGLTTGLTVELHDIAGNVIDSAAEGGGSATLDAATCDFNSNPNKSSGGFRGSLVILDGATEVERLTLYDIWGGDEYEYEYTAPPVVVSHEPGDGRKATFTVELWDKDETERLSLLTPDNEDAAYAFQDLEYKSNLWGDLSCTFKLVRETTEYWEDLEDSNVVKVLFGTEEKWVGEILSVKRVTDQHNAYNVNCVGPSSKLKNMGSDWEGADLDPSEKASGYITDHILTDTDLGLQEGDVDTNDYEIVSGIEFFPGKFYEEMFNRFLEYNDYRCYVRGNKLYWVPRKTTPTYYVRMSECEKTDLDRTKEGVINWVQVAYTPDGSVYAYVTDFDQDSIDRHGKRCAYYSIYGTEAEAQEVAARVLAVYANLKPSSALTTDKVYDQYGGLVDPEDCHSLEVLHVEELLSTEETIESAQAINESNTWEVAECSFKDGKVTFSPGSEENSLSVLLKQLEDKWAVFA